MNSSLISGDGARSLWRRRQLAAGVGFAALGAVMASGLGSTASAAATAGRSASATTASTPVSAAVNGKGEENVFWRSSNGTLWNTWHLNGSWGPSSPVPNTYNGPATNVASNPVAATDVDSDVNVFWKTTGGRLDQSYISEHGEFGGWGTVQTLAGTVSGSSVAAVANPAGGMNAFFVGPNEQLLNDYSNSHSVWSTSPGLVVTGGDLSTTTSLSAVAPVGGHDAMDVYWKGTNGALWAASYFGGSWHGPISLGGSLSSAPVATALRGGGEAIFYRSTAGHLEGEYLLGDAWTGPVQLGSGTVGSSIQALKGKSTSVANVVFSSGGKLWYGRFLDGRWQASAVTADNATGPLSAVRTSTGTVNVVFAGPDGALWNSYSKTSGKWSGPTRIGSMS